MSMRLDMLLHCCHNTYMSIKKQSRMSIYLSPSVQEQLRVEANRQHRSMNAQVVWCLEHCLGIQQETQAHVPGETGTHRQDRPTR